MVKHSKRYAEVTKGIDRGRRYAIREAVEALIAAKPGPKFEESVDLALKLGIDTKRADQMVRGSFALPQGTGKSQRVIAFCEGQAAEKALEAGAIEAGGEELVEKIKAGWMDFDVAVAHQGMMRTISQLGRILGPQGKMPSPKSGTVTQDVATAVTEFRGGRVEYRADGNGNIHVPVGRVSWDADRLVENVQAFIDHMLSVRPAAVKGVFLQRAAISSTMGPGLRLAV